ncbi:MAG: Minf_1886 family protein [Pirellulaceae bacterium]
MTSHALQKSLRRIADLAERDGRYRIDAYLFVHQTLAYAELQRGRSRGRAHNTDPESPPNEIHFSPRQLCEAIREYAVEMYGMMARLVLNHWGVRSTSDFGEIVFQLIDIGEMTKAESDHRADFDDVYDFQAAFRDGCQFQLMDDSV